MKGYPKSRFDIVNNTQIQTIETSPVSAPTALYMQLYTSNKGTEDWELLSGLEDFTKAKGNINFNKHGQPQLTVAQALRSGAYVLGKRLVSENATLANTTVMARVVQTKAENADKPNMSYLYIYTRSVEDCKNFNYACKKGYGDFNPEADNATDFPLFTVTPMGRGESLLFFRLNPEYTSSRSKNNYDYIKYSFEILENNETLESIIVTMNPDIIVDGISQSINPKIKNNSNQIKVKLYEDGIYKLVKLLSETAVDASGNKITPSTLINMDFINGCDRKGTPIGGIVTISQSNSKAANDLWVKNKPSDIKNTYDLASEIGVPLSNGTYGTMGISPINNTTEYDKMMLTALGKNADSSSEGSGSTGSAGSSNGNSVNSGEDPKSAGATVLSNGDDDSSGGDPGSAGSTGTSDGGPGSAGSTGTSDNEENNCTSYDPIIYDLDAYKIDASFDCNYSTDIKNAFIDIADFRGDMVFLCDLGTNVNTLDLIKETTKLITFSNYTAIYHNYFKILDPFTKKEITVTMPYLLIDKMTKHISEGPSRPFAGIANNITFNNIIEGSVNLFPVETPGINQKQELANINVNYMSLYDGIPVMDTMYTNSSEYTQLSYLHNIMAVQEIIKIIRTRCPRTRYTFMDGSDLETYISDVQAIVKEYSTNFKSITCEYMADEKYEQNNIFYAVLKVQFKNFVQEEYFKIIAIS